MYITSRAVKIHQDTIPAKQYPGKFSNSTRSHSSFSKMAAYLRVFGRRCSLQKVSSWPLLLCVKRIAGTPRSRIHAHAEKCICFAEAINFLSQCIRPGRLELAAHAMDTAAKPNSLLHRLTLVCSWAYAIFLGAPFQISPFSQCLWARKYGRTNRYRSPPTGKRKYRSYVDDKGCN